MAPHRPPAVRVELAPGSFEALTKPWCVCRGFERLSGGMRSEQFTLTVTGAAGPCHALLCWYVECWAGGDIDYGPHQEGAHGAQLAFVPPQPFVVEPGQCLHATVMWGEHGLQEASMQLVS